MRLMTKLMWTTTVPARPHDLFVLPWGQGEMTAAELLDAYPHLAHELDGQDPGACLMLYYERNPVNGTYMLRDSDAENDMAEIIGFQTQVVTYGDDAK